MKNVINQIKHKQTKKGSKEIKIQKAQSTKIAGINQEKKKESNDQIITEPKSNNNQKKLPKNSYKLNLNKTEIKSNHKVGDSQLVLNKNDSEIKKEDNEKKVVLKEKNKINNNINNNDNIKKTTIKTKVARKDLIQDINLEVDDDNKMMNMPKENLMKSYNMAINMNFNVFDDKNMDEKHDDNDKKINAPLSPSNKKKSLKSLKKQIPLKNEDDENLRKSMKCPDKKGTNIDILIVDNEFDDSKINQKMNLKKTQFPNLSTNPFITNNIEKDLMSNAEENNNISELKKNLKQTVSNNTNNSEKIEINIHHTKCPTLNISNTKTPSDNPNSSNMSGDVPSVHSNSKKTLNTNANTELAENQNLDKIYRKFLVLAKRGDKEKFLDIYSKISSNPNGININYKDENGNTALHYACDEGNLKIVEILLEVKCDPNIKNIHKQTPLHLSAKRGYFDISKLLIEHGAQLNLYDSEKNTPIHYVCQNNSVELLIFFLTKRPIINVKNIYEKTPKDLTTNAEIKSLLDDYNAKKENKSINNKINTNIESPEINLKKTTDKNDDNFNNIVGNRNRSNTLNIDMKRSHLNKNRTEMNSSKVKPNPNYKNKEHLNMNESINVSTNIKIELESHHKLNNSVNIFNNKISQSPVVSKKVNKNLILKDEIISKKERGMKITDKEKEDPNIYFQNTNNINNNNININIYSIDPIKKSRAKTQYISSDINKTNYKNSGYITVDESYHNNSNIIHDSINKTTELLDQQIPKRKYSETKATKTHGKLPKKSKFYTNQVNNILDNNDSCDNNILNLNKTEENIIPSSKIYQNLNTANSKNTNKNVNASMNMNYINTNTKNKNSSSNNQKYIQSTEQLLSKAIQQPKKKPKKVQPKISEDLTFFRNSNKIKHSKTNQLVNKIESVNRSNILPLNPNCNLLNSTAGSIEQITPSNFVCLAQLGKGSFGEVYLVRKVDALDLYAMKVLRKDRIIGQNLLKYAIAERNVLSSSHHPFIVKFNYAFQTSSKLFLVIEYCPNGDLSKHLMFEKRFKEQRAKFYICEIILALENLHKRDIIFRDLKPDNVVLDKDGHCKLTDFGLSKEGISENSFAQSFCGSIAYLAPEMLKKQGHGKAVDWYLLGVLFYEMLVGITPYFTTKKEDIFHNIECGDLKIPNFVSKEAGELLRRLLERNPSKRLGGGGRDADEIKEHPYFKDVDWKKVYEKKIKPPSFVNYMDKTIKYYKKPKLFANDDFLNKTDDQNSPNMLEGWSVTNKDNI